MAHTPGPWAASKQKARRVTASGIVICNAVLRNRGGPKHKTYLKDEHEAEANAQLIAAAPELLAACGGALDLLNQDIITPEMMNKVGLVLQSAIARAKGE